MITHNQDVRTQAFHHLHKEVSRTVAAAVGEYDHRSLILKVALRFHKLRNTFGEVVVAWPIFILPVVDQFFFLSKPTHYFFYITQTAAAVVAHVDDEPFHDGGVAVFNPARVAGQYVVENRFAHLILKAAVVDVADRVDKLVAKRTGDLVILAQVVALDQAVVEVLRKVEVPLPVAG